MILPVGSYDFGDGIRWYLRLGRTEGKRIGMHPCVSSARMGQIMVLRGVGEGRMRPCDGDANMRLSMVAGEWRDGDG